MSGILTRPTDGYRRPAWNEAVSQALPARFQGESTPRWVARVPLIALLVLLIVLSFRLSNTAFIDEALSINIGHDHLGYWSTGEGTGVYGSSFSGLPFAYPVLAAALDTLGGLELVRAFSLLCVVAATIMIHRALVGLGHRSAGMFAAAVFALTGSVMFVGALATFDALVLAMLAAALWTGVRQGWVSAVATGVILGLVPVVKYTGIVFLPVVLGVLLLVSFRRRVMVAGVIAAVILGITWSIWSDRISESVALNTIDRTVSGTHTRGELVAWLTLDIGILLAVALIGVVLCVRRGLRHGTLASILLAGGLALPVIHLVLGQDISFDKHTAFSALFLAPLAGYALAVLSRGTWKLLPTILLLLVVLLFGFSRSEAMYNSWVDVGPVVEVIQDDPRPGLYISPAKESLDYHLRDQPGIEGVSLSSYAEDEDLIRVAVEDQDFQAAILRTAGTGASELDEMQDVLLQALRDSANYELTATMPAREHSETDLWLVFTKVSAG